ncbi:hypothetical protein GCM10007108_09050 [Thermogymnomonas acidicola]|uniref:Uncharacterized protein n=1 Tax=Thermogymnomonas acidicola TaxID=399579 RepID=A0AA37BR75_9ARCH|nr:hypothetical protein [Thermogymnomonas acidicola]GGM73252.1 hypothetical protein GCM10007108_09050 [Thermogymnomonas acidicola]
MEPIRNNHPNNRRTLLRIAVSVIAVIAVVVAVLAATGQFSSRTVNVMAVNVAVMDNNTSQQIYSAHIPWNFRTYYGGSTITIRTVIEDTLSVPINVTEVSSATPGFSVPGYVLSSTTSVIGPGKGVDMAIGVRLPDRNFAGVLDITVYVNQV